MKAVYYQEYGSPEVLQYGEQQKPDLKADQVLVRVYASSVNPIDWKLRKGDMKVASGMGLSFPKIPGVDIAGQVVETGSEVTGFRSGDMVFAKLDGGTGGAYAQYAVVSSEVLVPMPGNMNYEEAASVPLAALTALQGLRDKGELQPGEKVLVNGASGGVGTFAVQIARALGAGEVVGVCSTEHVDLVRSLGVDRVIDYKQEDFTQEKDRYDLIFDAAGKSSYSQAKDSLRENGRYVTTVPDPVDTAKGYLASVFSSKQMKAFFTHDSALDLTQIREWIEAGQIKPVIDRVYDLEQAAQAHRESEEGDAAGKIVLRVGGEPDEVVRPRPAVGS